MEFYKNEETEPVTIKISREKTPTTFKRKVEELVGDGMTLEEAEKEVEGMLIELELCYHKDQGLFAIESEAITCLPYIKLFSPYTGEECTYEK